VLRGVLSASRDVRGVVVLCIDEESKKEELKLSRLV
jgi:hypothetical protein